MGKVNELAEELAELKKCGEMLVSISENLMKLFSGADEVPEKKEEKAPAKKTKPAPKKEVKLTDVRAVLAEKTRAGFMKEVKELLIRHGAEKLSGIDPAEYEALMAEAEVLGNG